MCGCQGSSTSIYRCGRELVNRIFVLFEASLGYLFGLDAEILGEVYEFCPVMPMILLIFPRFYPHFLRDEIALGRGVHRF